MLWEMGKWLKQKTAYNKDEDPSSHSEYSPKICARGVGLGFQYGGKNTSTSLVLTG